MQRLLLLAALGCILAVPAAFAEESCAVSGPTVSKEAMTKSLQDRGYTQIRGLSIPPATCSSWQRDDRA